MAKSQSEDEKILQEARERFHEAVEEESESRARMREELRFAAGEQWPDDVRKLREEDPNGSRPCLVMDKLGQYRRQVVNDARQNKPAIKVRPVDDGADKEVAEILQGLTRHIEDRSCADIAYDNALDSATGPGLGWFRVMTEVVSEKNNEQEAKICQIPNIFSVYADPCWKMPDGSDMMWAFVTDEMPRKQFEADYPNKEPSGWEAEDSHQEWVTKDMVRVAEYYRIKETTQNCLVLDNGEEVPESDYWSMYQGDEMRPQVLGSYEKKTRKVEWFKLTAGEILDRTEIPCSFIPVIPVVGNVHWVDGKRHLTGMIFWGQDGQRAYNYGRSAFVEQVALAPKAPYVAAAGQIEAYEQEWADANTSNQPVLRYDPQDVNGTVLPPPQRQIPPQPSAGWLQEMQLAERDIQASLGMYAASIGNEGQEKSGRAILARQKEGDTSTFHYIDNLSRSIRHAGRIIVEMIPRIYDTRRVVRILGEDGESSQAVIDPRMTRPIAKVEMPNGKVKRIFNPNIGKYDVSVSVGPAYNTKRMEAATAMTEILSRSPQLMQIFGDLWVKSQDWPMADEIAKRMKAMLPPQILQAEQQEGEDAKVKMAVDQALAQVEQQVAPLLQQFDELKAKAGEMAKQLEDKQMDHMHEAEKLKIDAYKAETERLKAMAPAFAPEQIQALVVQAVQQLMTPQDLGHEMPMGMEMPPEMPPDMQMMQPEQPPIGGFFTPEESPPLAG